MEIEKKSWFEVSLELLKSSILATFISFNLKSKKFGDLDFVWFGVTEDKMNKEIGYKWICIKNG